MRRTPRDGTPDGTSLIAPVGPEASQRLGVLHIVAVMVLALVGLDALEHLRVGAVKYGTQQLLLQGPALMLAPQAAMHLALMLHELGTNSRKYGALSKPEGRVTVSWQVKHDCLHLQWSERGGPPVKVPSQHGFGTMLIQNTAQSLAGSAQMVCVAEGLGWDIDIPLKALRPSASGEPHAGDGGIPGIAGAVEPTDPTAGETNTQGFSGKRVLVVEDEVLVSMVELAMLEELGVHPVGPVQSMQQALEAVAAETLDAALLDGNLAGAQVDAVAAALTRKEVPFVFVTGYGRGNLPAAFRNAPLLSKPFTEAELIAELRGLFEPASANTIRLRCRPGAG